MARPRSEEARRKVLVAASDLMAAKGVASLTIDQVAVRSGVAKSKTPRSDTTRARWWKRAAAGYAATRSWPTPHTMSTFSTKTRRECFGTQ